MTHFQTFQLLEDIIGKVLIVMIIEMMSILEEKWKFKSLMIRKQIGIVIKLLDWINMDNHWKSKCVMLEAPKG